MNEFLKELKYTIDGLGNKEDVPSWIHRYYRKLSVACLKEAKLHQDIESCKSATEDCMIIEKQSSFTPFVTPYTLRTLKPFILIDRETEPPRVKLMSEICQRQNRQYNRHPIVYKYLQRRHIKAINKLCETHFWPGIDETDCGSCGGEVVVRDSLHSTHILPLKLHPNSLTLYAIDGYVSESLEFPEFSVVVEYQRLVIGFGFLVPDVSHTDAYISFLMTLPGWRRSGIAKYMLYHLINTCRGKDITLHVSASNSQASLLYQKFAFKPEEFIRNFYDKFIPANSRECRHAFFLRLSK